MKKAARIRDISAYAFPFGGLDLAVQETEWRHVIHDLLRKSSGILGLGMIR